MPIFKVSQNKLDLIKEIKIDLEKDIQMLTEENLEIIFGLKFVSTEFQLNSLRIDSLAFDEESQSFVVIEYKKDRSFSVIDQGYAYLALMLNHKADFILEYNEHNQKNIKRENVDWSQSRVIFIANSFTKYQQEAINFQDLPIELWEVKKYSNSTLLYNQLQSPQSSESINKISKNQTISKVSKEVKRYRVDDLFKKDWIYSRDLYEKLIERIQNLVEVNISSTKLYVKVFVGKTRLIEIIMRKKGLLLSLPINIKNLKDPEKYLKDVSHIGRWTNGESEFEVSKESDIDYAIFLIKQVYEKFYKE